LAGLDVTYDGLDFDNDHFLARVARIPLPATLANSPGWQGWLDGARAATHALQRTGLRPTGERNKVSQTADQVKEATPSNAPGDFYVAKDECITCGVPEAEAPDLMAFDEAANSCYFRRQPSTPAEVDQAVRAVWVSCCRAVRYRGSDPDIQKKIAKLGDLESIDVPISRLTK